MDNTLESRERDTLQVCFCAQVCVVMVGSGVLLLYNNPQHTDMDSQLPLLSMLAALASDSNHHAHSPPLCCMSQQVVCQVAWRKAGLQAGTDAVAGSLPGWLAE